MVMPAVKALLSEMKLRVDEWPLVLSLVQGALNHQLAQRLGSFDLCSLPAKTPMAGFVHPTNKEVYVIDWLDDVRKKHMSKLNSALHDLHRDIAAKSDKLRQQARGRRDKVYKPSMRTSQLAIFYYWDPL